MPILAAEPCIYPENLFESGSPGECAGQRWWVLHTKARQEKALARVLHRQALPFFLPLFSKELRIRKKDIASHHPLFPGYLFLRAERDGLLQALSSRRVARHLDVPDQEQIWLDLRQIHRLIETGQPITPEPVLTPGTRVEVCSGPLMGMRGEVLRTASGNRLIVKVDFIQHGASVLLEGCILEPIRD